jgi:hypothetical protein
VRLNTQFDVLRLRDVTNFMTKKNLLLILFAIGLAVVYVVWFTDWFRPAQMRISYTDRDARPNARRANGNALPSLIFRISPQARFTELKVVSVAEYETNKNVVPVWHLISDSNSVPTQEFFYGQFIHGMRPAVQGVRAEELETNITYRMFLTAGRMSAQKDFDIK